MEIFIITFIIFLIIILIMSLGVMLMNKNIKGSCGGLNAISGSNKCSVCNKDIDPNSPLVTQLNCKKHKKFNISYIYCVVKMLISKMKLKL